MHFVLEDLHGILFSRVLTIGTVHVLVPPGSGPSPLVFFEVQGHAHREVFEFSLPEGESLLEDLLICGSETHGSAYPSGVHQAGSSLLVLRT